MAGLASLTLTLLERIVDANVWQVSSSRKRAMAGLEAVEKRDAERRPLQTQTQSQLPELDSDDLQFSSTKENLPCSSDGDNKNTKECFLDADRGLRLFDRI